MKPSKETLLNSYIDVKGWVDEDVKEAAKWLAENTGTVVSEENLDILPDLGYHFLIVDERDNTVWSAAETDVEFKEQLTDLSFMTPKEEPMTNTLETLKKAKQELAFAKDCLKASQEAVEDAQKAYADAYKAFKEEADGLLREEHETPEMCSEDDCEEFLAMYKPVDDCFEDLTWLTVFDTYRVKTFTDISGTRFYKIGAGQTLCRSDFTKRFQRLE